MTIYRPQNHLKDTKSLVDIQRSSRLLKMLAHIQLVFMTSSTLTLLIYIGNIN